MTATSPAPIRVLHITASATPGGGPEHLYRLAQHLPAAEVLSLAAAPQEEPYWSLYAGLMGRDALVEIPHRSFAIAPLWRLIRFARRQRVDIVHSHGKGAGLYGRIAGLITGIPCVHTFHGIHMAGGGAGQKIYADLERFLGRHTALCLAVSPGEARQVTELGFCPAGRLAMVPNGVLMPGEAITPDGGHAKGAFTVVHMSRYDRLQKNSQAVVDVALALRALGGLDGLRFVLLGEGPELPDIRRRVAEHDLGGHFHFEGFHPRPREALRGALAYLSTSRWEGLPLAVLEAMAEGVPVVATDVVGNRDAVVHGRTGWLFPVDDPAQAASRLVELRRNPEQWLSMSEAAEARAREDFDVRLMARRVLQCYRKVLGRPEPAPDQNGPAIPLDG